MSADVPAMIPCKACERLLSPSETECRRCGKKVSKSETTVRIRETGRDDAVIPKTGKLVTLAEASAEMEKELIAVTIERYGIDDAAKALGIGRTSLWKKRKRYGLTMRVVRKREQLKEKTC